MTEEEKQFIRGYVCCVTTLVKGWNDTNMAEMLLSEGGYKSLQTLKDANVDSFDLKALKDILDT